MAGATQIRVGASLRAGRPIVAQLDEAAMVEHLAATGRYRILQKLDPRPIAAIQRPEFPLRGLILDTETTGLDHRKYEIIEIGAVAFTFNEQGDVGDVILIYSGLQQPSVSIPAEIVRLTGITDDMVAGQVLDMRALRSIIDPADLIIAHNAGFDRPFCEALSPVFSGKPGPARTPKSTGPPVASREASSAIWSDRPDFSMRATEP